MMEKPITICILHCKNAASLAEVKDTSTLFARKPAQIMSGIDSTATEAQRLRGQEDAIIEKSKKFLTATLRWSFALLGAKEVLIDMQVAFIIIVVALIMLFGISSRTTRSGHGTIFINLAFLLQGCLVVGIAIDSIILNFYIKWVIYAMFLAIVATNPHHQQIFQEMKQIFKSKCEAASSRLRNLIQSQPIIQNLLNINVEDREDPSMNNNPATQQGGGDGGGVGEDIV